MIGINIKMVIALLLSAFSSRRALDQMVVGPVHLALGSAIDPTILSLRFMLNPEWA